MPFLAKPLRFMLEQNFFREQCFLFGNLRGLCTGSMPSYLSQAFAIHFPPGPYVSWLRMPSRHKPVRAFVGSDAVLLSLKPLHASKTHRSGDASIQLLLVICIATWSSSQDALVRAAQVEKFGGQNATSSVLAPSSGARNP